jgi:hypothetical protein
MEREEELTSMRRFALMRTVSIAIAVAASTLAAPSEAKSPDEAAFKLLSASGTQTHTFHEEQFDSFNYDEDGAQLRGSTQAATCVGTQSQSVRYHSAKPAKMYVFLRRAHGLHTLISDKPNPDSGLDFLSVPGEMTLSRSVSYEQTRGCGSEPAECPETTFPAPVLVFGTHDPSRGISPLYDTNLDLPSGLDRSCEPMPGAGFGPLSPYAAAPDREIPYLGAIPRSQIFDEKRKRLSGEDSFEFSYETASDPGYSYQTTVTGTYGEAIAVELKRLKRKK